MSGQDHVLSSSAAQAYYDRFGKKQDSQGFYENPPLDDLIAHGSFQNAQSVFEFGCGTGKFAARLLEEYLPPTATYQGCDISPVMIELTRQRLAPFEARAQAALSEGAVHFPVADCSLDRVLSTYVLDLLSEDAIRQFFVEARRTLLPGGRLCLASLTQGIHLPSRIVSSVWTMLFRLNPAIVGGCRPLDLGVFVEPQHWRTVHQRTLAPFGVPSQVLVLERNP